MGVQTVIVGHNISFRDAGGPHNGKERIVVKRSDISPTMTCDGRNSPRYRITARLCGTDKRERALWQRFRFDAKLKQHIYVRIWKPKESILRVPGSRSIQ